jgi:AraC-like DNA-binding protein
MKHFSSRSFAAREQFEAWRSELSEYIELLPTADTDLGLPGELYSFDIGAGLSLMRSVFTDAPAREWRHKPKSYLDHWCVVLARGDDVTNASANGCHAGRYDLSFRSLAMPFEGRGQDREVLTVLLSREECAADARDFDRAHERTIHPELGVLLASFMTSLAAQLPKLAAADRQRVVPAIRALIAACVIPSAERVLSAEPSLSSLLVARARKVVVANMASPDFGPAQLCRLLAVSRSKLYRLFESTGGIARFINRERLHEAHRRLSDPAERASIHVVGSDVGFLDHSTFSRAFRREYGYSPSEARERAVVASPETAALSLPRIEAGWTAPRLVLAAE